MNLGEDVARLRAKLLSWYDRNRRDLPWRARPGEAADAYGVWISEVMLQQTRVETVRPYYQRWMEAYPDLRSLADAELDDVLLAWQGLGYYSRARNLHRAVREVRDRYGSEIPADPEKFRALPGVGRYTAGAVMSIAFDLPEPIVDGNVRRVFARLLDEAIPADRDLWSLAEAFSDTDRPGDANQALMELGALVCTPRNPSCPECPLADGCLAHGRGTEQERPARKTRKASPVEYHGVAVVDRNGSFLLRRRPETGLLAGMWEFPGEAGDAGAYIAAALRAAEGAGLAGAGEAGGLSMSEVRHVFTHLTIHYLPVRLTLPESGVVDLPDGYAWVSLDEMSEFALPAAQLRILEQLRTDEGR